MDRNKEFEVVISERAAEMLVTHVRFLAEVSPQSSDDLRKKIIDSSKSLQHFPERNPYLSDPLLPANKYRKMTINKRYLLIYQVVDRTVYVDYIVDCRQDYRWLL